MDRKFRQDSDPEARRKMVPGLGAIVENAFGPIVERNTEYEDGYKEKFDYWIPAGADHLEIFLYASEDQDCRFVFSENPQKKGVFDTLDNTTKGRKCFEVKRFNIPINNINKEKQQFQLRLEYRQNGINLYYTDPNDGKEKKVEIDTTAKPGAKK